MKGNIKLPVVFGTDDMKRSEMYDWRNAEVRGKKGNRQ